MDFQTGIKAPQAAGIIHSDFEKGFIRAVTMSHDDLIKYGSEKAVKEAGRLREEGKNMSFKMVTSWSSVLMFDSQQFPFSNAVFTKCLGRGIDIKKSS